MNKKTKEQVLIAMMYASGLDPLIEDDYYQNLVPSDISRFLEGVCSYFGIERDSWMLHFTNIGYMDSPSETVAFFLEHTD